jgi:predicted nucleic acid-binding protein
MTRTARIEFVRQKHTQKAKDKMEAGRYSQTQYTEEFLRYGTINPDKAMQECHDPEEAQWLALNEGILGIINF